MDQSKLLTYAKTSTYTDATLTLNSRDKSMTFDIHRVILASASSYFHALFTFGSNYTKTSFTINEVDDVDIMYDLIMSWYGSKPISNYEPWLHLLKTIKCKSFLCIDVDPKLLYDLKVPPEGLDLLLEVMDLFDYTNDRRLLSTVKRAVPENYDLTNFSREFIELINPLKKAITKIVSGSGDDTIKIWDAASGHNLRTLNGHVDFVYSVAVFNDNSKIVSGSEDHTIKIWDAASGQILHTLNGHTNAVWSVVVFNDD